MQEMGVWSLGQEDPLEKEMATHASILAWRIPWTEEPGRLQSMGVQRVTHDWATNTFVSFHFTTNMGTLVVVVLLAINKENSNNNKKQMNDFIL